MRLNRALFESCICEDIPRGIVRYEQPGGKGIVKIQRVDNVV